MFVWTGQAAKVATAAPQPDGSSHEFMQINIPFFPFFFCGRFIVIQRFLEMHKEELETDFCGVLTERCKQCRCLKIIDGVGPCMARVCSCYREA